MALAKHIKGHSTKQNPVCQNPTCTNETRWFRSSGKPRKYCCTHCCKNKTGSKRCPATGLCRVCGLSLTERGRGKRGPCRLVCVDCRRRRLYLKIHKVCASCARPFFGDKRSRCCSPKCGNTLRREQLGIAIAEKTKNCLRCGLEFKTKNVDRNHCSGECAIATSVAKAKAKATSATCKHCGSVFQPKRGRYDTFCSRKCCFDHLKANIGTEANKKRRPRCAGPSRPTVQRNRQSFEGWERRAQRRARENGVYIGWVSVTDILARDGSDCHICGLALDLAAPAPNPKAATLDHLIPLRTWRGAHVMENLKLAHFACNSIRSDRKITAKLIEQCRARITGNGVARKSAKKTASKQRGLF